MVQKIRVSSLCFHFWVWWWEDTDLLERPGGLLLQCTFVGKSGLSSPLLIGGFPGPKVQSHTHTDPPPCLHCVRVALTPCCWLKLKAIQLDRSKCDYPVISVNWYHLSGYSLLISFSACFGLENFSLFLWQKWLEWYVTVTRIMLFGGNSYKWSLCRLEYLSLLVPSNTNWYSVCSCILWYHWTGVKSYIPVAVHEFITITEAQKWKLSFLQW